MKKLFFFLFVFTVFVSCEKDEGDAVIPDNINVTINQSGTVTLKVLDGGGAPLEGAYVAIYSTVPEYQRIFSDTTDATGVVNAGKVLQGQYWYLVMAPQGKLSFGESSYFQVVAGEHRNFEVEPFSNTGTVEVYIVDLNGDPVPDVNVCLLAHPRYSNVTYSFGQLVDEAWFIEPADASGKAVFTGVPASTMYTSIGDYSVMAYYDSNNYDYPVYNNSANAYRNQVRQYTIEVEL
jgi:hypothetical protein